MLLLLLLLLPAPLRLLLLLAKPCRSRVSLPGLSLAWLLLWLLLLLCSLMGCSLMQLLCVLLDLVQHGQVVSRRSAQRWGPGPQLLSDGMLMRGRGGKLQLPLHPPSWKASMGATAWVGLDQQWTSQHQIAGIVVAHTAGGLHDSCKAAGQKEGWQQGSSEAAVARQTASPYKLAKL